MKSNVAFVLVLIFATMMVMVSCGGNNKDNAITSEKNVPDSALTDSIPASGEDAYQQDVAPKGRTEQLDSTRDSVDRKP
jgi:hypothetical protein